MSILRVNKIAASGQTSENTGSVFFDGDGDYLEIADTDDLTFGSGDYTIEAWIYIEDGTQEYQGIFGSSGTGSDSIQFQLRDEKLRLSSYTTELIVADAADAVTVGQWTHIAISRNGTGATDTRIFKDGRLIKSGQDNITWGSYDRQIGRIFSNADYDFQGYISNFRVVKGKALYTSNFTPPTTELEVTPETVLVACYDGENIFAEKTGKIIAAYGDRLSSPTPTATDSPIGITTFQPGLTRSVDVTAGPVFQGGAGFASQNWLTLPKGTTTQRNRGRGVFGGGNPGTANNTMQYVQIQSQGNALDFGDLTVARQASGLGGATRGVFGGNAHPNGDTMDFITIASTGNAIDFGNLQSSLNGRASAANLTRGIFAGGGTPAVSNEIDFITIATLGNASDFGNLSVARRNHAGVASPTRAVFAGGDAGSTNDTIDFVTIATTGNATDFGNLSAARETAGGASSSTRGVFMGGYTSGDVDIIEYITIATTGNATDFGNLSAARRNGGSVSNNIRGLYAGGHPAVNIIEFVTIASTGDANDFGDLLVGQRINPNHVSDSHGGLS